MNFTIAKLPDFVRQDAALMIAELIALQNRVIQQTVHDPDRYAAAYAQVFGPHDPQQWIEREPVEIAQGITTLIREVGLFVILDDAAALAALAQEAAWRTQLPPVRIARPGPIYTASRKQQSINRAAIEELTHRAAALTFAERLPSMPFDSFAVALRVRTMMDQIFQAVIEEASARNDGTARSLRRIEAAAWALINARVNLPDEEGVLQLAGNLPSLVCAHFAYREARQAPRIRDANPAAHPNFMPPQLVIPPWP